TFSGGASLHASCALRPHLELLLFNAVGPFIDVVPSVYGDLAFTAPPPTISWDLGWTLTGDLGGTVDLPFHNFTLRPVTIFATAKQELPGGSYSPPSNYCNASSDCPSGQICNGSHACVTAPPPPGGCNTNSDCAAGQTCTNHVCVTPPPPPGDNCAHAANG